MDADRVAPNIAVQPMVAAPLKRTLRRRARSTAVGDFEPFYEAPPNEGYPPLCASFARMLGVILAN